MMKSIYRVALLTAVGVAVLLWGNGKDNTPKANAQDLPATTAADTVTLPRIMSDDGFDMVFVEGGTFTMGCTETRGYKCRDTEKPAHKVTVSGFYIQKYEVTQKLWKSVMGSNPSFFEGDDNLPVEKVCWKDAQEFIQKLNAKTGKTYRLPTEAEWEFAARGGNKSKGYKYSGSNTAGDVAWYGDTCVTVKCKNGNSGPTFYGPGFYSPGCSGCCGGYDTKCGGGNSGKKTRPVGTKHPNELGVYDMSGNVSELVNDRYGNYTSDDKTNPTGPTSGPDRVVRGGSYHYGAWRCRVFYRSYTSPSRSYRTDDVGFRLALDGGSERVLAPLIPKKMTAAEKDSNVNNINMAFVKGGTFTMGCTPEQDMGCEDWEKPAHKVTLKDFYIGRYEVTQGLWMAVMDNNPSGYTGDNNLPVEEVSWGETQEFIQKLNAKTGKKYRLPTEAEWEFAARGGNKSFGYIYSGGNDIDMVAWYEKNSGKKTHPVDTKQPNELGLYNMAGNVSEWVNDWMGDYSSASQINPAGPKSDRSNCSVLRGGSSWSDDWKCRITYRIGLYKESSGSSVGFRLAHDP
jgi:formylglycine-generating enzyme required for sulfatase activity